MFFVTSIISDLQEVDEKRLAWFSNKSHEINADR